MDCRVEPGNDESGLVRGPALDLVEARGHIGDPLAMLPKRVELGALEGVGDHVGAEVEDALALDGRKADAGHGLRIVRVGERGFADEARADIGNVALDGAR